jgi:SM-20-related protein
MTHLSEAQLDLIADALVEPGYLVIDNLLPEKLICELLESVNEVNLNRFSLAGVGRSNDFKLQENIRSDRTQWIEPSTATHKTFLASMESLRVGINRRLFMGLLDYESHFAHYSVGAFYKKHLDSFREQSEPMQQISMRRRLSTVLYLNRDWQKNSGGELVIYENNGEKMLTSLLACFGRFVIFLSETFPHEVLPATRERNSIAGWFRTNEGLIR